MLCLAPFDPIRRTVSLVMMKNGLNPLKYGIRGVFLRTKREENISALYLSNGKAGSVSTRPAFPSQRHSCRHC